MEEKKNENKLPIKHSTNAVGVLIMFVCCWSLLADYTLGRFWQGYSVFALIYLILAIGNYGRRHIVEVLLWWLAGIVPLGLLGAAMLYNISSLTLTAAIAVAGLALFVLIYSIVPILRKRFGYMQGLTLMFLSLNFGIAVALVCRLLIWLD